jgi:hypothetical protein
MMHPDARPAEDDPMRQLPLPDALKDHVADLLDEIALTDADGRVVAFVISPDQREMMYRLAFDLFPEEPTVDALKAYKEGRCKTTAEVLARLHSLGAKEAVP